MKHRQCIECEQKQPKVQQIVEDFFSSKWLIDWVGLLNIRVGLCNSDSHKVEDHDNNQYAQVPDNPDSFHQCAEEEQNSQSDSQIELDQFLEVIVVVSVEGRRERSRKDISEEQVDY